jgi:thiol-disulfide isomerase/thioredoxin
MSAGPPRDHRSSRSGYLLATLPAVAIAVLAVVAARPIGSPTIGAGPSGASSTRGIGIAIGDRAPEFVGPGGAAALTGLDRQQLHLADFAGHPLWIVFWASWCTPCHEEAPEIEAVLRAHAGSSLSVLAIAVQDPETSVRAFMSRYGLDYEVGLDPTAAVRDAYGGWGLPIHFFLDGTGTIRDRYIGQLSAEGMEQHLRSILATGGLLSDR